jgi:hypothetical protein
MKPYFVLHVVLAEKMSTIKRRPRERPGEAERRWYQGAGAVLQLERAAKVVIVKADDGAVVAEPPGMHCEWDELVVKWGRHCRKSLVSAFCQHSRAVRGALKQWESYVLRSNKESAVRWLLVWEKNSGHCGPREMKPVLCSFVKCPV